jgi:hypothetical protein
MLKVAAAAALLAAAAGKNCSRLAVLVVAVDENEKE